MISRLTALAAVFAVLGASTLAFAATTSAARKAELRQMPVVQLPTVQIVAKRSTVLAAQR